MNFTGRFNGRPVQGIMVQGRVVTDPPDVQEAFLAAVSLSAPVYIAGVADETAALEETAAGYATVATILDPGSAVFDPELVPEPIPEDAIP